MNILLKLGVLLFCFNLAKCEIYYKNSEPIAEISNGKIQGKVLKSRGGRDYLAFHKIPYAKVPERFEDPIEADSWSGIRNGTEYGAECLHLDFFTNHVIMGEEECLFINIFVPKGLDPNQKVPVMFFTHGGAYRSGSGNYYRADYFMDENVILVTYNYRLAALGFLNTKDGLYANMGFKDQNFALRFLQKNIGYFGGDKNSVTIFGESAGAASSQFHTISPLSKGLFKNVIIQSSSAVAFYSFDPKPGQMTEILAKELNCPTGDTKSMINCLKKVDIQEFVRAEKVLLTWHSDPAIVFRSSVEKVHPGKPKESLFLSENPYNIMKRGEFNTKNIILGVTIEEGLFLSSIPVLIDEQRTKEINQNWNGIAPITLMYEKHIEKSKMDEFSQTLKKYYFGDKKVDWSTVNEFTNLYSDAFYNYVVKLGALLYAKHSVKVFPYILDQKGRSILPILDPRITKEIADQFTSTHADDLQFQFNIPEYGFGEVDDHLLEFSKNWVSSWVHFAKTGEPSSWGKEKWDPIDKNSFDENLPIKWFHINKNPEMKDEVFEERMKFWKNLDEKYDFFGQIKNYKDEL